MKYLNQLAVVALMGLRAIPQRFGVSVVVVVGMACVVAVTISILSLSTGLEAAVNGTARDDQAIVLSQGSQFEPASSIPRDNVVTISDAPEIKKGADGKPIVSPEFFSYIPVTRKSDHLYAYMALRGVGPNFFDIHPEVKLLAGRMFLSGRHELVVGSGAHAQYADLDVGDHLILPAGEWTVTGIYDSSGDIFASQALGDVETVISALRFNVFRSVWVELQRPDLFQQFKKALTTNPALSVDVMSGVEFWEMNSKNNTTLFNIVAYVVGGIMGLGAVFAALNTMYSVVSTRSVEIATLRAIGFDGRVVITSVLIEALALAAVGAAIGACAAWFAFNGNPHLAGQVVIKLAVTPALIARGIAFACVLGFIGGLFPALRAATMPVTSALRAI